MSRIAEIFQMKRVWLSVLLVSAGAAGLFSEEPILAMGIVPPPGGELPANQYSIGVTAALNVTTGSTSISCTGRCTYKAVYNGTFLTAYGKGFTPHEVIEFRLNEVYLGRSDTSDANGEVVTWFKRSIPAGTYELYAHEAHTGKNSTRLTFVVTTVEPQTIITTSSNPDNSATSSVIVTPTELVAVNYSLAALVVLIVAAMIVMVMLARRRASSNNVK